MEKELLFKEKQYFRQPWLWIILIGLNGLFVFGLIKQIVFGSPFGSKTVSNNVLVIVTLVTFLLSFMFAQLRLETNITKDGIYVRFFPFQLTFKFYPWNKIKESFVRQYSPIGEYGGWGIRGLGKNRALNVSGNKGIQLVTDDGLKLLIGTQKSDEATKVLEYSGHLTKLVSVS